MELELRDVGVTYGHGRRAVRVVEGASFAIERGQTLGLIGESGSGKSSIAKAIVGLVPVDAGNVSVRGVDMTNAAGSRRKALRASTQMVFQDPQASLDPRMTVSAMLREASARRTDIRDRRQQAEVCRDLLNLVGMDPGVLGQYPHELSGGQRQRIAIARALAVNPSILVLDEVTSSLDVSVQGAILNMLRDLQRKLGLTYLFISHNLAVVRYMSDAIAVMHLGRIVEYGREGTVWREPRHPYTRVLSLAVPTGMSTRRPTALAGEAPEIASPPSGCRFRLQCPVGPVHDRTRRDCIEQVPDLHDLRGGAVACHHPLTTSAAIGSA